MSFPCSHCNFERCQISFYPCNHTYHIPCVFPWPMKNCPCCNSIIEAIRILPSNYDMKRKTFEHITNNIDSEDIDSLKLFGIQRYGRWGNEELAYGKHLLDLFCSSCLPLTSDTKLPVFLGHMLQCSTIRLRGKIRTGKQVYHRRPETQISHIESNHILKSLRELSRLGEAFLDKVHAQNPTEAAIISYQSHRFWLRNFIRMYQDNYLILDDNSFSQPKDITSYLLPVHVMAITARSVNSIDSSAYIPTIMSYLNWNPVGRNYGIIASLQTRNLIATTDSFKSFVRKLSEMKYFCGDDIQDMEILFTNTKDFMDCLCSVTHEHKGFSSSAVPLPPSEVDPDRLHANFIHIYYRSIWLSLAFMDDYVRCNLIVAINQMAGISITSLYFEEIDVQDENLINCPRRVINHTNTKSTSNKSSVTDDHVKRSRNSTSISTPTCTSGSASSSLSVNDSVAASHTSYSTMASSSDDMNQMNQLDFQYDSQYIDEFMSDISFMLQDQSDEILQIPTSPGSSRLSRSPRTTSNAVHGLLRIPSVESMASTIITNPGLNTNVSTSTTTEYSHKPWMETEQEINQAKWIDDNDHENWTEASWIKQNISNHSKEEKVEQQTAQFQSNQYIQQESSSFDSLSSRIDLIVQSEPLKVKKSSKVELGKRVSIDENNRDDHSYANNDETQTNAESNEYYPINQSAAWNRPYDQYDHYYPITASKSEIRRSSSLYNSDDSSSNASTYDSSDMDSSHESRVSSEVSQSTSYGQVLTIFSNETNVSNNIGGNDEQKNVFQLVTTSGPKLLTTFTSFKRRENNSNDDDDDNNNTLDCEKTHSYNASNKNKNYSVSSTSDSDENSDNDCYDNSIKDSIEMKQSQSKKVPARRISLRLNRELKLTSVDAALKALLRYIPFDIVELWIPVTSPKANTATLYFAGSATSSASLTPWSSYSRSFKFDSKVGLPGRVSTTHKTETFHDISALSPTTYLRVGGAKSLGIHASVGIPIASTTENDQKAVVVFYSKQAFSPNDDLVNYLSDTLENLRIKSKVTSQSDMSNILKTSFLS